MDPQITLQTILDSMPDTDDRDEAMAALAEWLMGGGFVPTVPRRANPRVEPQLWWESRRPRGEPNGKYLLRVPAEPDQPAVFVVRRVPGERPGAGYTMRAYQLPRGA